MKFTKYHLPIYLLLPFLPLLIGCSSLGPFERPLTISAITLLQELQVLLLEYEGASIGNPAAPPETIAFEASQMTRHRNIAKLLTLCAIEVPSDKLDPYRARLAAVPRGVPRAP